MFISYKSCVEFINVDFTTFFEIVCKFFNEFLSSFQKWYRFHTLLF